MGRYTLKVNLPEYGDFNIVIPERGMDKLKVDLMTIDSYTINKNPNIILKHLDFDKALVSGQETFYISYMSNGQEKRLNTIFKDSHDLKSISDKGERKIDIGNSNFYRFINNVFLPMITNRKFYKFLKDKDLIGYKLDEWVYNYLNDYYKADFCIEKIKEYASEYKQFRALILGVELYKDPNFINPIKPKTQSEDEKNDFESFEPIEEIDDERPYYHKYAFSGLNDDMDPDRMFALYSEEELRAYDEYLNSLPDDFEIDEDRHR